jgi:prephenate dehydrogenase
MWRDIALANRTNLSRALETFTAGLQEFRRALKNGDAQAISEFFEQARERRERWSKRAGSPSPE